MPGAPVSTDFLFRLEAVTSIGFMMFTRIVVFKFGMRPEVYLMQSFSNNLRVFDFGGGSYFE
jgi:hypothetical protein